MKGARISQCSKTSNLFPDELSQVESRVGTMISVKFWEAKLEIQEKKKSSFDIRDSEWGPITSVKWDLRIEAWVFDNLTDHHSSIL